MPTPEPLNAQRGPYTRDPSDVPARENRFGGRQGTWLLLRAGILANEAPPTSHLQLVIKPAYRRVRFAVIVPATVSQARVHLGRWISARIDASTTVDTWVEDSFVDVTGSATFAIEVGRDPVGAYVDGIVGAAAPDGLALLYSPSDADPT